MLDVAHSARRGAPAIRTAISSTSTPLSRNATPTARRSWTSATGTCCPGWPRRLPRTSGPARSDTEFPLRLIPRRHRNFMNSSGITLPAAEPRKALQPGVHASRRNGLVRSASRETAVTVASRHDSIPSVVEADDSLRRDVIAMHHAFGGLPTEDREVARPRQQRRQARPHRRRIRPDHRHAAPGQHPGARDGRLCRLNQIASIRLRAKSCWLADAHVQHALGGNSHVGSGRARRVVR